MRCNANRVTGMSDVNGNLAWSNIQQPLCQIFSALYSIIDDEQNRLGAAQDARSYTTQTFINRVGLSICIPQPSPISLFDWNAESNLLH